MGGFKPSKVKSVKPVVVAGVFKSPQFCEPFNVGFKSFLVAVAIKLIVADARVPCVGNLGAEVVVVVVT